jgi:two-component system response regulator YesN
LLVDRKLPDIDGVQLIQQIKNKNQKMRKVIFTGFPSLNNAQKAIDYGIDAYLTKPIDPKEILNIIEEQLEISNS